MTKLVRAKRVHFQCENVVAPLPQLKPFELMHCRKFKDPSLSGSLKQSEWTVGVSPPIHPTWFPINLSIKDYKKSVSLSATGIIYGLLRSQPYIIDILLTWTRKKARTSQYTVTIHCGVHFWRLPTFHSFFSEHIFQELTEGVPHG